MARFARHTAPRVLRPVAREDVVAVVAARDEAASVGACVTALLANGVREVVVVDDGSTDGTADAARTAGARVVRAPPPEPGVAGKAAACAFGAAATSGEWLWFVDADVVVAPDALARLLAEADETGAALVSAFGRVATPTPATAWLLPEIGLGLARRLSLDAVADPSSAVAFASGQCLLVRRSAYDAAGGHDVTATVEDVALAARVKARGLPVRVVLGPDFYTTAMYGTLGEAWNGLRRSASTVRPSAVREVASLAAALLPVLLWRTRAGKAAYAAQVVASAGGRWVSGAPVWPAAGAPFAQAWLAANALAAHRRAPVRWRGRDAP
jgi:GT2 family glycosyltransferase